jgi:hypothetical protein
MIAAKFVAGMTGVVELVVLKSPCLELCRLEVKTGVFGGKAEAKSFV